MPRAAGGAGIVSVTVDARWCVHLPTADVTCVRLACARVRDSDPWPLSRVQADVLAMGAQRDGRPHAVGAGRGVPLIHRQAFSFRGIAVEMEAHHVSAADADEIAVMLPPWDELTENATLSEDDVWELIDAVAAAGDARFGAVGDGEPLDVTAPSGSEWTRRLRRHVALLMSSDDAPVLGAAAAHYRTLPRSALTVMLR